MVDLVLLGSSRNWIGAAAVAAVFALPTPALAAPAWSPAESAGLASSSHLKTAALGSDGTGLLFVNTGSANQIKLRPLGGPVGAAGDLPAGLNGGDAPQAHFAPNGDALIVRGAFIAFRPAGAVSAVGAPVTYPGFNPLAFAFAPGGEALVVMLRTSDNHLVVALRPAGSDAAIDTANAQDLGAVVVSTLSVHAVALEPTGGAIVLWSEAQTVWQAVRPPGEASFDDPTTIGQPSGLSEIDKSQIAGTASPSGHAIVTWLADFEGDPDRSLVAAARAPGGEFPASAQVVDSAGDDLTMARPAPGATTSGDGLVSYQKEVLDPPGSFSCGDPRDSGVFAVKLHAGAFSGAAAIGASQFPVTSGVPFGAQWRPRSAGSSIALPVSEATDGDGDRCTDSDKIGTIRIRRWSESPTGLVEEPTLTLATGAFPTTLTHLAASPSGGVLAAYTQEGQPVALRVFEDASTPDPDPDPGPVDPGPGNPGPFDPSPGNPGPGNPGDSTPILPIALRALVKVAPIQGARPRVTVICPAAAADTCAVRVAVHRIFGVGRGASASQGRTRKRLLGRAAVRVEPGQQKKAKIRLTKAGRARARGRRATPVRLVVDVEVGAQKRRFTAKTKLRPLKPKRRQNGHRPRGRSPG